jgi:N-formylglutamate amidohydrolase
MVQASDLPAPFRIRPPHGVAGPLLIATPHSGRVYPTDLLATARLDALTLRRSEDALVDDLVSLAPSLGCHLLSATFGRAYVDVNRDPLELDPSMFSEPLPGTARTRSDRVAAGLGVIPRVVGLGLDIYGHKLPYKLAQLRIDQVHKPYHTALRTLLEQLRALHGYAVLIDWHSMPSSATGSSRGAGPQIVVGDRRGRACDSRLTALVAKAFRALGYRVSENDPYAGGYTTELYGKPAQGLHTIQIEMDRALYLDEIRIEPSAGFSKLKADIDAVLTRLASEVPALTLAPPTRLAAE